MSASREPCPFCDTEARAILAESKYAIAIADAFPVSAGHSLVIPLRHVHDLFDLSADELADAFGLVGRIKEALQSNLSPAGFNIGVNIGRDAGQTVMHAHVHIIPRYKGDVSDPFGGVRGVIPAKARYSAS
jgi:diadenosine tetraphosphate (Ap4A) HIT family hydrolase